MPSLPILAGTRLRAPASASGRSPTQTSIESQCPNGRLQMFNLKVTSPYWFIMFCLLACVAWNSCNADDSADQTNTVVSTRPATALTLKIEPNEKWWGGVVASAPSMPVSSESYAHDLMGNNSGNQIAPVLISNHGRYVRSDGPFKFEFGNGELVATSHFGRIQSGKSGGTLREAYRHVSMTFFPPPSGTIPDEMIFLAPQHTPQLMDTAKDSFDIILQIGAGTGLLY